MWVPVAARPGCITSLRTAIQHLRYLLFTRRGTFWVHTRACPLPISSRYTQRYSQGQQGCSCPLALTHHCGWDWVWLQSLLCRSFVQHLSSPLGPDPNVLGQTGGFVLEITEKGFLHSRLLQFTYSHFPFLSVPILKYKSCSYSQGIPVGLFPFPSHSQIRTAKQRAWWCSQAVCDCLVRYVTNWMSYLSFQHAVDCAGSENLSTATR